VGIIPFLVLILRVTSELPASAETRIIPSITGTVRYDSNVWASPKEFIPQGTKSWDVVSGVSPQVEILNKSRLGDTKLNAGVSGNVFVNNPVLNYVSTNAGLNSDLTGWIRELIPGAKLQVSDSFYFTPEPPGFITGVKPETPADTFARGVVAFRANTYTNYATVNGAYAFSRTTGLQANYTNSLFTFGQVFQADPSANLQNFYFDSIMHYASIGPWYKWSRKDTIGLNYQPTYMTLTGAGTTQTFTAHSVVVSYTRETPDWTFTIDGGPAYLEQGSFFYYNGGASLTTNYDKSTSFRLSFSRQLAPAFFSTGGGLISNTAGASIQSAIVKNLVLAGSIYYSENTAVPVDIVKFTSLLANAQLTYRMTRTLSSSIGYYYNFFDQSSQDVVGAPIQSFQFDRHYITFSISSTWK
jgi:hypothetical protein